MTNNVIRDGYTRPGYIEPVERLHEGLTFEFRPMLPEIVEEIEEKRETAPAKEATRIVAAALAQHLTKWSERDEHGCDVGVNFDTVRRLPRSLLVKLYKIVSCAIPSDPIPNASSDQNDEYTRELMREINGEDSQQETDAKNSVPA